MLAHVGDILFACCIKAGCVESKTAFDAMQDNLRKLRVEADEMRLDTLYPLQSKASAAQQSRSDGSGGGNSSTTSQPIAVGSLTEALRSHEDANGPAISGVGGDTRVRDRREQQQHQRQLSADATSPQAAADQQQEEALATGAGRIQDRREQQQHQRQRSIDDANSESQNTNSDPKFATYTKMRSLGLPDGAIRQKMQADGLADAEVHLFFGEGASTSSNTPHAPPPVPPRPEPPIQ